MSKYVLVKEAPTKLSKGELVITGPNYLDQIRANVGKAPRRPVTAPNHLRGILSDVFAKYDPDNYASQAAIPLVDYEGIEFKTDFELHDIVLRILSRHAPTMSEKYVDYQVKNKPYGVKTIYFTGSHLHTGPLTRNGIDKVELKDLEKDEE